MAGTANYAGIVKWAQLDLQRIQHRDYVGHLSIFIVTDFKPFLEVPVTFLISDFDQTY